jgi:hypothetical protein
MAYYFYSLYQDHCFTFLIFPLIQFKPSHLSSPFLNTVCSTPKSKPQRCTNWHKLQTYCFQTQWDPQYHSVLLLTACDPGLLIYNPSFGFQTPKIVLCFSNMALFTQDTLNSGCSQRIAFTHGIHPIILISSHSVTT